MTGRMRWIAKRSEGDPLVEAAGMRRTGGLETPAESRAGAAKATECPKGVQVTRGWIVVKVAMTGRKSGLFQKSPRVSNGSPPSRFAGVDLG